MIPDQAERDKILAGLDGNPPTVKRVYAQVDEKGISYHEINDKFDAKGNVIKDEAVIGKEWNS